jgi:transposase
MSKRELSRVEVLARVKSGQLRVVDAAVLIGVSYRQGKRLWKRYRAEGAAGLKHRSAGRRSNRGYAESFRYRVLGLVREKYGGRVGERFGPTLAAEHLKSEDGQEAKAETLRRWMLEEGLWSRERRRRRHRRRRERKEHFGELVQMDGSFHEWLEGRGPGGCLMDLVDDATNRMLARLGKEETIWAAGGGAASLDRALRGAAGAVRGLEESLPAAGHGRGAAARGRPITQFGRMCRELGIELISASSPQAKGRVERIHGTHQDRLVKKLRRKQISRHREANRYLEAEYLEEHNRRFGRAAARREDYHRRAPGAAELDKIFRLESERVISGDWVVRYGNRFFQLEPESRNYASARGKVVVWEWPDGRMGIEYRGRAVRWGEIAAPVKPPGSETKPASVRATIAQRKWVPPADHPWRQAARRAAERRASGRGSGARRSPWALPSASP